MRYNLTFLCCFLAFSTFSQTEDSLQTIVVGKPDAPKKTKVTLTGSVFDQMGNEALAGALLNLQPGNLSAAANANGGFTLSVRPGTYSLEISLLGYETFLAKLEIYADGAHGFRLSGSDISLGEVTIEDRRNKDNVQSVTPGIEQLSIEKIERQSKLLGEADVLRSLQSVTGVTSVGEGASGFNVRGGNTDENLIFQDGNLVFNPLHALGFFSLFHPDMVSGVTLYKGGTPARYGGRLSSVLDVRLREGNDQRLSGKGGVSVATSRLALEGPLVKNKASFNVGARASYFDWILRQTKNVDLRKSQAFFYDLTAKADARITPTTKAGFTAFAAKDDFRFADEVKFDYSTYSAAAYLKQLVNEKINLNAQLNVGQYTSSLYDIQGNDQSKFTNRINYQRATLSGFYQPQPAFSVEAGAEMNRYEVAPGELEPLGETVAAPEKIASEQGNELSLFLHNQWIVNEKLEVAFGIRQTFFRNVGPREVRFYQPDIPKADDSVTDSVQFSQGEKIASYMGLEPHFSLRYNLTPTSSVKLGYHRSFQFFSQISNTASAMPIDVWQLSNRHVEPQKADNFTIGYYRDFESKAMQTHFDFFYRKLLHLIEYKDFAHLLLNEYIETELLSGIGKAYGIEFYVNKTYGKHRFEVNYTWSRSLRQVAETAEQVGVNNGKWYPSNYDKPHNLNLNYQNQLGKKVSFTVNFTYSTGRPTTAPTSSFSNSNVLAIPVYSDRNKFRIPDYHRLDLALDIGHWGKRKFWQNSLTLSVYNFYGRKNAFSVFFRQKPAKPVTAYRLAVLGTAFPAITYNFKF